MTKLPNVTFHANASDGLWPLFGSAVFVTIGILMVIDGEKPGAAWASLLFFGACFLILGARALLAPRFSLQLDAEGFTTRSPFRTDRVEWRAIEQIGLNRSHGGTFIAWRLRDRQDPKASGVARVLSGGWDGQLDGAYGPSRDETLDLMIKYHQAAFAG